MGELIWEFFLEIVFYTINDFLDRILDFIFYIIIKIIRGCWKLIWMVINFFHKLISKETLDDDSLQETVVNESEIITDDVQPKSKMLIKSYTGQKRFKAQRALRSVAHNLSFPQAIITLREGGEIDILEDINNLSDHYQTLQKAGINFELIV